MNGMYERFTENPMPASDRPKYFYKFFVTGNAEFPFDMLRYDSCHPATSQDAELMHHSHRGADNRSICMFSYTRPTPERWWSFGWSMSKEKP